MNAPFVSEMCIFITPWRQRKDIPITVPPEENTCGSRRKRIFRFLISIHEVVKELMEHTEKTLAVRSRLFQYLAEQFIEPVKVLREIAKPVRLDQEGREIYRFRAYLKEDRQHPLREKMLLYPKAFQESRILVQDKNGMEYGHLSFEDDRIYFCIIPLLKEKLARVKMEVRDGKVIFYFRLEKEAEQYRIPDRNLEIAKLLTKD